MAVRNKTRQRVRFLLIGGILFFVLGGGAYIARRWQIERRVTRDLATGLQLLQEHDYERALHKIGPFLQRHPTDTEPTQLVDVSGQRPYRPVYSGRGGMPQRRQDLEESHRIWLPLPQLLPNNAIQSLGTLNASVDVTTDNTLQSP